jgi:hypothetical protein
MWARDEHYCVVIMNKSSSRVSPSTSPYLRPQLQCICVQRDPSAHHDRKETVSLELGFLSLHGLAGVEVALDDLGRGTS